MKKVLSILLAIMLVTSVIFAEQGQEFIDAIKNTINVTLNGEVVEADNLLFEGRTYVQLREISNMIGADLTWDPETSTANLTVEENSSQSSSGNVTGSKTVKLDTYMNPFISFKDLDINSKDIYGVAFKNSNEPVTYNLQENGLEIMGSFNLGVDIELSFLMNDNRIIRRRLVDGGLKAIKQTSEAQIVYVPADPSAGFNFPYMLRIPSNRRPVYETDKKYLSFDMVNDGGRGSFADSVDNVYEQLDNRWQGSIQRADMFGYPIMMPIVPRTNTRVRQDRFGSSSLYEHALDRASVYVKELTTTDSNAAQNRATYNQGDYDYESFYDLDEQIKAMMKHSITYLNDNGFGLEDQVIMDGYSASGTFTDRFTNLHPEMVKMVISGATVDDLMLPISEYKGKALNFPVGIADFNAITGKDFDLQAHNSVARLVYMGKDDTNNTVGYSDCYFDYHNDLIVELFGKPVLPRAMTNIELYGEGGGQGMFILDVGIKHGSSKEMNEYINNFIQVNADSNTPVYPEVTYGNLEASICD